MFTAWPDITPPTRYAISITNRILEGVAVFPFALGWLLGIYSSRKIDYQLRCEPTLPIMLAACLIAFGAIWDGHLLYSKAIGAGLVAGWGTMTIIEGMSRVINPGGAEERA